MSLPLLPKRPAGNSPAEKYHQRIWDVIKTLIPIGGRGVRVSRLDRGTVFEADPGAGGGEKASLEIPEWTDTGYSTGDLVVRSTGIKSGPNTTSIDDGRKAGTWEAQQDIPAGSDTAGPSLDNTKWRQVAVVSTERIVWRKGNQRITIDVGRDADKPLPRLVIESDRTSDTIGPRIDLSLSDCGSDLIHVRQIPICEVDVDTGVPTVGWRRFVCGEFHAGEIT